MQLPIDQCSRQHRHPSALAVWGVVATCLLGTISAQDESAIEKANSVFSTWAETSEKLAKEKAKWELSRDLLSSRIAMLEKQIKRTKELTAIEQKKVAGFKTKTAALTVDRDALKASMDALAEKVGPLEERVVFLVDRLPEVVKGQIATFAAQLPRPDAKKGMAKPAKKASAKDGKAAPAKAAKKKRKRSVTQRFSSTIGVLLGINKFHRGVHVLPERHKLSGADTEAEVATMYIGLGQAYFVNAKGDKAGIGTASPDGWVWVPADAIAPQVARALAVYENKAEAAFVTLPLRVR